MAEAPSAADVPPQAPAEPEAALELKHCALGDMGGMMAKSDDNRRSNTSYKSEASCKSKASVGHDGRMHFNARPRSVSQDLGDCDGDGVAAVRTSGYMSREVATQQSRLTSSLLDKLGLSKKLSFIGSAAIRPLRRSSSIMSQISCTSAVFDDTRVGTFTQHGLAPTAEASTAKINQDRGCVFWPYNNSADEALLCIFDGHGPHGERVSEFCVRTLPGLIEEDGEALRADPAAVLRAKVLELESLIFSDESGLAGKTWHSGTTATVVYARGDELWIAWCGDSRCVLASRREGAVVSTDLTHDHAPSRPDERSRVTRAGGFVQMRPRPARVRAGVARQYALAMTRSLGDGLFKENGVTAEPEVQHYQLSPAAPNVSAEGKPADGDFALILASDGVWEFVGSAEGSEIVAANASEGALFTCCELVAEGQARWKKEEGDYRDDITAIVVLLPFLEKGADALDPAARRRSSLQRRKSSVSELNRRTSSERRSSTSGIFASLAALRRSSDAALCTDTPVGARFVNMGEDGLAIQGEAPAEANHAPATAADAAACTVDAESAVASAGKDDGRCIDVSGGMFAERRLSAATLSSVVSAEAEEEAAAYTRSIAGGASIVNSSR